jgi:hypothetical protein
MATRKTKKRFKKPNGRKPLRTARLNLMIEPKLKKSIHEYAKRHHKSLSTIITDHFVGLLEREKGPNVEQI